MLVVKIERDFMTMLPFRVPFQIHLLIAICYSFFRGHTRVEEERVEER